MKLLELVSIVARRHPSSGLSAENRGVMPGSASPPDDSVHQISVTALIHLHSVENTFSLTKLVNRRPAHL